MKKVFMLLTGLVLATIGSAQEYTPEETILQEAARPSKSFEIQFNKAWKDGLWIDAQKSELTYDKNGKLIQKITSFSDDGVQFTIGTKTELGRNIFGVIHSMKEYIYQNDEFILTSFSSYEYNSSDLLTRKSTYETTSNGWDMVEDVEYYYDVRKKIANTYISELENGVLKRKTNRFYIYSNEELVRMEIKEYVNQIWKDINYVDYEYNNDGTLKKSTKYFLSGSSWLKDIVQFFGYQNGHLASYSAERIKTDSRETIHYWTYDFDAEDRLTRITKQDLTKGQLNNTEMIVFMAKLPSSVSDHGTPLITLNAYPIPAHDQLTLQTENSQDLSWNIYDLSGKLNKAGNLYAHSPATVDISDLAPGMYLLVWNSNSGETGSKNIVVAR